MCGIVGFWNPSANDSSTELENLVLRMAGAIHYRGPDDQGTWVDPGVGLALGFRRLAILDLTPSGRQPMVSSDGRYIIIFNGEVYNHLDLRQQLEALKHTFRGTSDTEVMLAAISQWGIDDAVNRFNGMFAIAVWDRRDRSLYLLRDRLGIKPLYYGWVNGVFFFGSELKALRAHPSFRGRIDRNALTLLLRHNYIPAPYSIYTGIEKLMPGTILKLDTPNPSSPTEKRTFWSAREIVESGVMEPLRCTAADVTDELETLLKDSVKMRMVADVPLGGFLSGGIDSSTVIALMQSQSTLPIKTFTLGFYEDNYDEALIAKQVANYLGTEHTELYVTPQEAQAAIPRLPEIYDEPFSDSSQIPTYLVSQLARQKVTVSLSGDGGDELFGGYDRYLLGDTLWKYMRKLPATFRKHGGHMLTSILPRFWDIISRFGKILPRETSTSDLGSRLFKFARALSLENPEAVYRLIVSHEDRPENIVLGGRELLTALNNPDVWVFDLGVIERMQYLDMITYLPNDILTKLDRASMAVSLEARVPMLDHRLVEFAWTLPLSMKVHDNTGKWILRQVVKRYIPEELINRPKMGFGVPIGIWMRGPLREWVESLLNEDRLRREGYFNPEPIRKKWSEHLSGQHNWQYYLWNFLMFQAWLEETASS